MFPVFQSSDICQAAGHLLTGPCEPWFLGSSTLKVNMKQWGSTLIAELQIRRDIEDNSKIISLISQPKRMW